MATIEYKSKKDELLQLDFNPFLIPYDELIEIINGELLELNNQYFIELQEIISLQYDEDFLTNQTVPDAAIEHLDRITDAAENSFPFDKKTLKNKSLYSIDAVNIGDFKYEKDFRKCVEIYYYYLLYSYQRKLLGNVSIIRKYSKAPYEFVLDIIYTLEGITSKSEKHYSIIGGYNFNLLMAVIKLANEEYDPNYYSIIKAPPELRELLYENREKMYYTD